MAELRPRYAELDRWDEPGLPQQARQFVELIESGIGRRVDAVSLGPTAGDKRVISGVPVGFGAIG